MKKLLILLILVLVLVAGFFIYKDWRRDFIRKQVPHLVFLESDSLYKISYGDIYIDEINGELIVKELRFTPDSTYKKPGDSSLPLTLLDVYVPELHISGIQTDAAILNKEIIARKIQLSQPVVTMYTNARTDSTVKKEVKGLNTQDLYKVILRKLDKIAVDTILIDGANYAIAKYSKPKDTSFAAFAIDAYLYQLNISDSTSTDSTRIMFAKKADLSVKNIIIHDKKGFYHYKFDDVQVHSGERKFAVKNIYIVPLLSEVAFMRAAKWQTDRFNFDFNGVMFTNTDIGQLLEGNLIADSLRIEKSMFKIYRDLSYPRKNDSKVGNYPHQLLSNAPMDVALKNVVIRNAYIEYKEKNPKSDSSGSVSFHNAQATLYNVTNLDEDIARNPICRLDFHCNFLGQAPVDAYLSMYLKHPQGKFAIKGTLNATEATVFNKLTRPMGLASIEKGKLNRLDFDLAGYDYSASGTVRMLYEDLKVSILEKDEGDNELKKKGLISFIANIVIKDANPLKNKSVRIAHVKNERDVQKSFFNLIWKTIFVGVKESVGIVDKKKKQELKEEKKEAKAERKEERKEERQQKREERREKKDSVNNSKQ